MVATGIGGENVQVTPAEAHSLTEAIAVWARGRSDIRALALAGSWPRGSARADSDLDLLMLVNAPAQYRSHQRWLYHIALPEPFRVVSHNGAVYGVVWSCHALLEPTAELELIFASLDWASRDRLDTGTQGVIRHGFQVIVDKDGHLQRVVEVVKNSN